ncbi:agmatinase [Paenibacillus glucanolyticus]|uniref:Agmatinase n=1 Tax=Paenibacillus glucanolyticus TaxID=59843 RepID=A0A163K7I2_9BACL|nr:agmatinase family protein [Paenibacillus glucanolyticus]KZS47036.1 agmatinase [Paenibacillus glucanolyticus]
MNYIYGNTPCYLGAKNMVTNPDVDDIDVIVYGIPWEGAVTWGDLTSCELGPKMIRLSSARYSGYLPELNHLNVLDYIKLGDMGDVDVVPSNVKQTMDRISSFANKVWGLNKFPVALGGDHSITYPILKALTENIKGSVGVIHIDAHYDNNQDYNGDLYGRSSPFARIYELDGVDNKSIVHFGIHGPRNKAENGRLAHKVGATTVTINDIRLRVNELPKLVKEVYDIAKSQNDYVYLSICSDILDHAFNPGGPVDCNGLTPHELLTVVYEICKLGVVGMDFVEVYPNQDNTNYSSHLVTSVLLYAFAGLICNREKDANDQKNYPTDMFTYTR